MRILTAQTFELDDVELAVNEVLEQLDLEHNLLEHSVGVVSCYAEFLENGVVAALQRKLPFDLVGGTSYANATGGGDGLLMLAVEVFTCNELRFAAGMSAPLGSAGDEAELQKMYGEVCGRLSGEPSLMIAFAPLLMKVGGDEMVALLDKVSGGVPLFGATAVDHTSDYHLAQSIYRDGAATDRLGVMMICGEADPLFLVASISDDKVLKQKAVITASQGNNLLTVNGISAREYIESLGLGPEGGVQGVNTVPFVIDFGDGTKPVTRSIFTFTEEGYAVGGGAMPVGSTLSLGAIDYDDVVRTTGTIAQSILASGKTTGALMFSCLGRNLALGIDTLAELKAMRDALGGSLPMMFSYAGGEICPLMGGGRLVNRFHNVTLVACVF